jgi:hypothetical protein
MALACALACRLAAIAPRQLLVHTLPSGAPGWCPLPSAPALMRHLAAAITQGSSAPTLAGSSAAQGRRRCCVLSTTARPQRPNPPAARPHSHDAAMWRAHGSVYGGKAGGSPRRSPSDPYQVLGEEVGVRVWGWVRGVAGCKLCCRWRLAAAVSEQRAPPSASPARLGGPLPAARSAAELCRTRGASAAASCPALHERSAATRSAGRRSAAACSTRPSAAEQE